MKVILVSIFSMLMFLQTSVSKASDYTPIQYSIYSVQNSLVFRLALQNDKAKAVQLSIYNGVGDLLYTETNNQSGATLRAYDMHLFGAGVYKVVIEAEGFKTVETVKVGVVNAKVTVQTIKLKADFQDLIDQNAEQGKNEQLALTWLSADYLTVLIEKNAQQIQTADINLSWLSADYLNDLIEKNAETAQNYTY